MSAQEMVAGSAAQARAMTVRVCLVIAYYEEGQGAVDSLNSVRLEPGDSIVVVDDGSKRLPARDFIPKRVGEVPVILVELPQNRGIAAALQADRERLLCRRRAPCFPASPPKPRSPYVGPR